MTDQDRGLIVLRSRRFAEYVHRNDHRILPPPPSPRRKFIVHPAGVASILESEGFDDITIAAGWSHDTVEDHPEKWTFDMFERWLNHPDAPALIRLQRAVTYNFEYRDPEIRRGWYLHALTQTPEAMPISAADLLDNLRDDNLHYRNGIDALRVLGLNPMKEVTYLVAFLSMMKSQAGRDPRLNRIVEALREEIGILRQYIER
jgi:(p)ppGpp synthase/HD superfamily hydrolase